MAAKQRPPVPRATQVGVFFRDGWLCSLCHRPTVFPLTFKLLAEVVSTELPDVPLAMYNDNWRRDESPLLDELGACVDHVKPWAKGGEHDVSNFATACARCNARKSDRSADEYLTMNPAWVVRGRHGEPQHWDGLASLFVVLARQSRRPLTAVEKDWLQALEAHYAQAGVR